MAQLTLTAARTVLSRFHTLGRVYREGYGWLQRVFVPALRRLATSSRSRDRRMAAEAYSLLGDLHDLNGAPRAAIRAYNKAAKLAPNRVDAWHSIGCMLDNMGEFKRARHPLRRALKLSSGDELIAGDLERVEWAMLNPCPALYDGRSKLWEASEALALGQHKKALASLGRRRTARARQTRACAHSVAGAAHLAVQEWERIAAQAAPITLQHTDWFYTFRGAAADDATLWRLMLWKVRSKLEGGVFHYPPTLAELDVANAKRFELYARYELARCQHDVKTLVALAGKYPAWREPGETALRAGVNPAPTQKS